ncbi:uncharacterized protein LOC143259467 [Megalopta genalis]|uniref:uncharacterized protein LOC143259467 n=1 Tax=Megalopta genalis TaxID=115081 RepID=UPI003FD3D5C2
MNHWANTRSSTGRAQKPLGSERKDEHRGLRTNTASELRGGGGDGGGGGEVERNAAHQQLSSTLNGRCDDNGRYGFPGGRFSGGLRDLRGSTLKISRAEPLPSRAAAKVRKLRDPASERLEYRRFARRDKWRCRVFSFGDRFSKFRRLLTQDTVIHRRRIMELERCTVLPPGGGVVKLHALEGRSNKSYNSRRPPWKEIWDNNFR